VLWVLERRDLCAPGLAAVLIRARLKVAEARAKEMQDGKPSDWRQRN
jgi:hypothetical protein